MKEKYYNVEAVFWKEAGVIYRDNTKIIFSEDEVCDGIILMLNPGKCIAKNEEDIAEKPKKFHSEKSPLLNRDQTQGKIAKCVKTAHNNHKLLGYVFIINLSNRREPKQENLSKEDFTKSAEDIIRELEVESKKQENKIKWIWVAFGKNYKGKDKEYVDELKCNVVKMLSEHELFTDKIIGKSVQYIHPGQGFRGDNKRIIIKEIEQKIR